MDLLNDSPESLLEEVFTTHNVLFLLAQQGHWWCFLFLDWRTSMSFLDDALLSTSYSSAHVHILSHQCRYPGEECSIFSSDMHQN